MEENRLAAKMKLTAKNTQGVVVNMGPSWYRALEAEFTKPYFLKVCAYIFFLCVSQVQFPRLFAAHKSNHTQTRLQDTCTVASTYFSSLFHFSSFYVVN